MKNLDQIAQQRRIKQDQEEKEAKEKLEETERNLQGNNARLTALQFYIMEMRNQVENCKIKTENYESIIDELMVSFLPTYRNTAAKHSAYWVYSWKCVMLHYKWANNIFCHFTR